jgi:hypothetical protein
MEGAKSIHRTKIFFLSGFLTVSQHHTRVLRDTSQGLKRFSFFNNDVHIVLAVFSSDAAGFLRIRVKVRVRAYFY